METQKNRGNKDTDLKKDSATRQDVNSQKRPDALGKKSTSSNQRDEKDSEDNRDLGRKSATDKNNKR